MLEQQSDHYWYLHEKWLEMWRIVDSTDHTNARLSKLLVQQPSNGKLLVSHKVQYHLIPTITISQSNS